MDIHKPKPVSNLREFLSEIAVVVCGILIAIGLEQGVEAWRRADAVSAARSALQREIALDDRYFVDREAMAPCVEKHIAKTRALVEQVAATHAEPNADGVGIGLGKFLETSEWETQRAARTLADFPARERSLLSLYYQQLADIEVWRGEEGRAWNVLSILDGPPKRLSDADIAGLRVSIQSATGLERLMVSQMAVELQRSKQLGVALPGPDPGWREMACRDITTG